MLEELKQICQAANSSYTATYEESSMMNVKADGISRADGFAYIEEFTQGSYKVGQFFPAKETVAQIYFCRFCEFQTTAEKREEIRKQIESEIVYEFMRLYNASNIFKKVDEFKFATPPPRFDANEVSIMLQFVCSKTKKC